MEELGVCKLCGRKYPVVQYPRSFHQHHNLCPYCGQVDIREFFEQPDPAELWGFEELARGLD